jgi:hypothetical protein
VEPGQGLAHTVLVVRADGRHVDAVDRTVDEDERQARLPHAPQLGQVRALGCDEQAVDALRGEGPQVGGLLGGVLVGVGEEHGVAAPLRHALGGVGELGEERVADVGHEEAEHVGAGAAQRPGGPVRDVVELLRRGRDAGPRVRGRLAAAAQHP